jgi:hypothetical protein
MVCLCVEKNGALLACAIQSVNLITPPTCPLPPHTLSSLTLPAAGASA